MTTAQSDTDAGSNAFDETNGVVEGLDGDSDGTISSDGTSAADRSNDAPLPLQRVGAAREFGIHITPTDAAGNPPD